MIGALGKCIALATLLSLSGVQGPPPPPPGADINESFTVSIVNDTATIEEGSSSGTVAVVLNTTDAGVVEFNLTAQTVPGTFEFVTSSDGTITVATGGVLDYETVSEHILTVVATNATSIEVTKNITVSVTDVNDNSPVFSETTYLFTTTDGAGAGSTVGTVSATDADGTAANNVVTFSITGGSGNMSFDIDSDTGALSVASGYTLSSKTMAYYTITITGTDSGDSPRTDTTSVLVGLCTSGGSRVTFSLGLLLVILSNALCRGHLI